MKRLIAALILCGALWAVGEATDITMNQRLPLSRATHEDYDLSITNWDTVYVVITDSVGSLVDTSWLISDGNGRWFGSWWPTGVGSYVAGYHAQYSDGAVIVEEEYFTVLDTLMFQGAASGLTVDQIADELESRGLLGTGTGAFACTVEVRDSSAEGGIYDVSVIFKNNDQTAAIAASRTNADGFAWFHLDSLGSGASYKIWLGQANYNFTFPNTLDLRGDTTAVFYGTAFDPGSPPVANKCRVYDQIFDIGLDSLSGVQVAVQLYVPKDSILRYDGYPTSPYKKTYTTTASGRWYFDLVPNSAYEPSGTQYIFRFKYPAATGPYFIYDDTTTVPDQETARYRDISDKM